MTRRDRIVTLLEHYRDVLEGLHEGSRPDEVLALMCRAWNHSSYQQLERLLARLRAEEPRLARHLLRYHLDYREVRRAWCRRCGDWPAAHIGRVHARCKAKGRSTTLVPRVVRFPPDDVVSSAVEDATDWLVERWVGEPDIPEDVHAIERERALRKVA